MGSSVFSSREEENVHCVVQIPGSCQRQDARGSVLLLRQGLQWVDQAVARTSCESYKVQLTEEAKIQMHVQVFVMCILHIISEGGHHTMKVDLPAIHKKV